MTIVEPAPGVHGDGPNGPLWGVVDCARDPTLYPDVMALGADAVSLFIGVAKEVVVVGPHLVRLREGSRLLERWRTEGRNAAWGTLFRSDEDQATLRRRCREEMRAVLPDGRPVLFRFWDPRVTGSIRNSAQ